MLRTELAWGNLLRRNLALIFLRFVSYHLFYLLILIFDVTKHLKLSISRKER